MSTYPDLVNKNIVFLEKRLICLTRGSVIPRDRKEYYKNLISEN